MDAAPLPLLLSSVAAPGLPAHEVPPGVYSVALGVPGRECTACPPASRILCHPWTADCPRALGFSRRTGLLPDGGAAGLPPLPEALLAETDRRVLEALRSCMRRHCAALEGPRARPGPGLRATTPGPDADPTPVMLLFSGGVDSTLLAALLHEALPTATAVDLVSICFDGGRSPDAASATAAAAELAAWAPGRAWRLIRVQASLADVDEATPRLLRLLRPAGTVMDLNIGAALWLAARGRGTEAGGERVSGNGARAGCNGERVDTIGARADAIDARAGGNGECVDTIGARADTIDARAGGNGERVDTIGARVDAIDARAGGSGNQDCTSSARVVFVGHGADELCCGYGEGDRRARAGGARLRFHAAKDRAQLEPRPPTHPCPGRHRTKFREGGWAALDAELALDLRRLWLRNLGRDDRLLADHGRCGGGEATRPRRPKPATARLCAAPPIAPSCPLPGHPPHPNARAQPPPVASPLPPPPTPPPTPVACRREARHPFLDEEVIRTVLDCPLHAVADLRQAPGTGDKRVLRACLRRLGLPAAAGRVKRAIQFGTRIGQLNNVRQFGGTRKANLANAGSVMLASLPALSPPGSGGAPGGGPGSQPLASLTDWA